MIVLGLYFGHVDPSVLEGLSDEKARQVSRLIYSYGLKAWFAEYLGKFDNLEDHRSYLGEDMVLANGESHRVYVVIGSASFDAPQQYAIAGVLQFQACIWCTMKKGQLHVAALDTPEPLRSAAATRALYSRASDLHPNSASGRKYITSPLSLHDQPSPLLDLFETDIFAIMAFPELHYCWEGCFRDFLQRMFDSIYVQVEVAAWNSLGKTIDAYVRHVAGWHKHFIVFKFNRGLSTYMRTAPDASGPWSKHVRFGLVTSADIFKALACFIRVLVFDLFPNDSRAMTLFSSFLEYMYISNFELHSDETFKEILAQWECTMRMGVSLWGSVAFLARVHPHGLRHFVDCCQRVCSNGYGTEAKFETGHKSTKRASRRINKVADTPRDMAIHIARCDTIELLMTFLERQRRDEAAAGRLGAQWDVQVEDEEGEETRVEAVSRMMAVGGGWTGPRRVSNVDELAGRVPELAQLPFAVSVWLLRSSSPVTMDVAYPIGMPHLDSQQI